jgi:pseudouridine synthase
MAPRRPTGDDRSLRLNRFLARAGFGSRRGVEDLVRAGRVAVDGVRVRDLGRRVDPELHEVTVDGQRAVLPTDVRVYAFHKPIDVVSTLRAQGGQHGLEEFRRRADLPDRFKPVGRLDQDSTGLLLWTDDGDLAEVLLRPRSGVWKTYEVSLAQALGRGLERTLAAGTIVLDGRPVRPCRVHPDPDGDRRRWTVELHEGRKRQIRRMFAAVDGRVVALMRVAVGPVQLGRLRPGDFRRLSRDEERALRQAVGRST